MAKSETLSETRQKFEEWAVKYLENDSYLLKDIDRPTAMNDLLAAFAAGRLQGLEEAAKIADQRAEESIEDMLGAEHVAEAIREKANG